MESKLTQIDIIILSFAQSEILKQVTINCLESLMTSEDPEFIKFNIIIIESQKELEPFQYQYGETIYPDVPFGYNRYMNIGISKTSSSFICLCNNDLLFHPKWATAILQPLNFYRQIYSASPMCTFHHEKRMGISRDIGLMPGHTERVEVSGWCLFFKRRILKLIGRLDDNFIFRHSSHDYTHLLFTLGLTHVLVTSSIVDHLDHTTLDKQDPERWNELMTEQDLYYKKKWGHRLGRNWQLL
jgi:GT2 family glycosyltransferase